MEDYILQIENTQIKGHTWRGIYTLIISMFTRLLTRYEDLEVMVKGEVEVVVKGQVEVESNE